MKSGKNSRPRPGFTLIEVMVTAAVAAIAIAGAFAFARFQIGAYKTQSEVATMQTSAQIIFESIARDIRNAGFATTFYAGAPSSAFGGRLAVTTGGNRGIPAIRVVNNAQSGSFPWMPNTDAISILRVESDAAFIPHPTGQLIPAVVPSGGSYLISNPRNLLPCASNALPPDDLGLVLVSDLAHHTEPASFILAINPIAANVAPTPGPISFVNAFGIDPTATSRAAGDIVPTGAGVGSIVVCARPVTYWVDNLGRLRMWRANRRTPNGPGGSTALTGAFGSVPIDPSADLILAEGVEDLQIAVQMSGVAPPTSAGVPVANDWVFSSPSLAFVAGDDFLMAEARAVRITAVVRTPRREDDARISNRPASIEDRTLPTTATRGCNTPTACYDPTYSRKVVTFQAELRNMRVFDLMSSNARATTSIRSYLP